MRTKDRALAEDVDLQDLLRDFLPQVAPGKRTRAERLPARPSAELPPHTDHHGTAPSAPAALFGGADPFGLHLPGAVQLRASGTASTTDIHATAAAGLAEPSSSLPFLSEIQASFGATHDVSSIHAHIGGAASPAAAAMGATAYAAGEHVAFAHAPDLHTAAHEAAHVVQQRAGVSLAGGVGTAGDSYERAADAVADAVVRGESAASLLGSPVAATANSGQVQHKRSDKDAGALPEANEARLLELTLRAAAQEARDGAAAPPDKTPAIARKILAHLAEISRVLPRVDRDAAFDLGTAYQGMQKDVVTFWSGLQDRSLRDQLGARLAHLGEQFMGHSGDSIYTDDDSVDMSVPSADPIDRGDREELTREGLATARDILAAALDSQKGADDAHVPEMRKAADAAAAHIRYSSGHIVGSRRNVKDVQQWTDEVEALSTQVHKVAKWIEAVPAAGDLGAKLFEAEALLRRTVVLDEIDRTAARRATPSARDVADKLTPETGHPGCPTFGDKSSAIDAIREQVRARYGAMDTAVEGVSRVLAEPPPVKDPSLLMNLLTIALQATLTGTIAMLSQRIAESIGRTRSLASLGGPFKPDDDIIAPGWIVEGFKSTIENAAGNALNEIHGHFTGGGRTPSGRIRVGGQSFADPRDAFVMGQKLAVDAAERHAMIRFASFATRLKTLDISVLNAVLAALCDDMSQLATDITAKMLLEWVRIRDGLAHGRDGKPVVGPVGKVEGMVTVEIELDRWKPRSGGRSIRAELGAEGGVRDSLRDSEVTADQPLGRLPIRRLYRFHHRGSLNTAIVLVDQDGSRDWSLLTPAGLHVLTRAAADLRDDGWMGLDSSTPPPVHGVSENDGKIFAIDVIFEAEHSILFKDVR